MSSSPVPLSSVPSLDGIRAKLGPSPRNRGWFQEAPIAFEKSAWLKDNPKDELNDLFTRFNALWKNGIVVWAHLVMANRALFHPGQDDLPGEVLYSLSHTDVEAAHLLPEFTDRLRQLKMAETPLGTWTDREREIAEDLASEMAWHAGFRLPDHWGSNSSEFRLNTILFHRAHLPGAVVKGRMFPLLILPELPFPSIVVPREYWTDDVSDFVRSTAPSTETNHTEGAWREEVEAAYIEVFGPVDSVLHETELRHAHIDVYQFGPREGRNFWTFASSGMSQFAQPAGDSGCPRRVEVIFYSEVKTPELGELVRNIAHYPFEAGEAFGHGHTASTETLSQRIFGTERFPALLFLAATRPADRAIVGKITIDGDPVSPLMIVPITRAELEFVRSKGVADFLRLIEQSPASILFRPDRPSLA